MYKALSILAKPLAYLLFWLYDLVGVYGIAIIIFTLIVRTILFPLYNSQMKQSAMMSEMQPKMQQIQKECGSDKEKYNQRVMEFYQQEGINPAKGCLPLLIQMPILFGLFAVLRNPLMYISDPDKILSIHESFLWIQDLSQPDKWILPILAGITTYFSYKITASATPQNGNSMKVLAYIFPLMIVWWGRSFPAGLTLYWFVGTLYMCIQQRFVMSKIKKDRIKREAEKAEQKRLDDERRQYEREHPELFPEAQPKKKGTSSNNSKAGAKENVKAEEKHSKNAVVEESDWEAFDYSAEGYESVDDYSDFYTEAELEKMKDAKAKNQQPKKKKKY